MYYSTDKPIDSGEQDLLGRASFSNQLGRAIYEYGGKDGLVIGLFGKWGTGKTSVINMAANEINRLAENDENKPLIMRFAPWNYSDKDNLISLFFQNLKNKIEVQDNEELKKKVGKALSDYSGEFEALSLVPMIGSGIAAVLKTIAQVQGANLMQNADLDKTRELLENALIGADKKIIIIIDDIDRLTNSQIRDVFQLVKQVADFPNVIYVLAMDREVVRSALSEVHNIDGNEYLEKIIQVPFELPELRKEKLHKIFFSKLDQIINDIPGKVAWDENYWSLVFRNCIEPYITTLRDVNRVINTFQFRYGMLYQETSFEDMVGITTLEVLEPSLYRWISNNKEAVCGGFMHGMLSSGGNKVDYRKLYYDDFERIGLDPELSIRCVATMFPVFAQDVKEHLYGYQPTADIRSKMRVAYEGRFEIYFMFDLDDIKVSRTIINACIFDLDRAQLKTSFEEINASGNIVYLLNEVQSLVNEIPYDRLSLLAWVLLELQGGFLGEATRAIFTLSACDTAEYLSFEILSRLKTEEERYSILHSSVENINKVSLGMMARTINRIELAYGRLAGENEKKDDQIISIEHLEELEKQYVYRIHDIIKAESILDVKEFRLMLYLWECFDKEDASAYMKSLLADKTNKLRFLCALAGKWSGTKGNGWSFNPKNYSDYFSQEEAYDEIMSFDKSKLNVFTESELIKLASFVLNYHKDEMDDVTEKEAQQLVNEWKCEVQL